MRAFGRCGKTWQSFTFRKRSSDGGNQWIVRLADLQLARLSKLTALRHLKLWGCDGVSDVGLKHSSNFSNLEELTLGNSSQMTLAGVAHLQILKKLREVSRTYVYAQKSRSPPLLGRVGLISQQHKASHAGSIETDEADICGLFFRVFRVFRGSDSNDDSFVFDFWIVAEID